MEIFYKLYAALFPYLLCIPLGYFLKKKELVPKKYIHKPLLFVLIPLLLIDNVLETEMSNLIILATMSFSLAFFVTFPAIWAFKKFDGLDKPLLISSFSFFNVLFFGIPTVKAIFDQDAVTTLICIYIGTGLFGYTVGYTAVAKSKFGIKKSIKEALKVPFIYAFLLAISLKLFNYELPEFFTPVLDVLGVIVSAAGMTLLGMNITMINFKDLDLSYFSKVLGIRTGSAILIAGFLLAAEYFIFDLLNSQERSVYSLIPLFPIAATLTVFASMLGSEERDSALMIVLSMVVSLILVPLMAMIYS
ncbi:hypothetical protein RM549_05535 [Salegentibacter sp. F188]|uniref:AEC family transporter n=1 Tax=Autumnicola patrickiae TaxID=3075591 RepID=A0ABU3DZW0_9FLAO|nr:AEC family transporter [Salegentibacter sp. F188]MDT0689237.1 hypothetical protein [Salegentibacter sp. F188]